MIDGRPAKLSSSLSDTLLAEFNLGDGKVVPLTAAKPHVQRDWSSTEHLIFEAREAMRISDERVRELEGQLAKVIEQARQEVQEARTRADMAERLLAEARARTSEAESWLSRINDQLVSAFGPISRNR